MSRHCSRCSGSGEINEPQYVTEYEPYTVNESYIVYDGYPPQPVKVSNKNGHETRHEDGVAMGHLSLMQWNWKSITLGVQRQLAYFSFFKIKSENYTPF